MQVKKFGHLSTNFFSGRVERRHRILRDKSDFIAIVQRPFFFPLAVKAICYQKDFAIHLEGAAVKQPQNCPAGHRFSAS